MQREGLEVVGQLSKRDMLLVGAALYAGEGSKTPGEVRFANSDPRMILFFVEWLRDCMHVTTEQMRLRLYLHDGLDLDAATPFWSQLTGNPHPQSRNPSPAPPAPPTPP